MQVYTSFSFKWLNHYNWLRYSKYFDGSFRLTCCLFGNLSVRLKKNEKLLSEAGFGSKLAVKAFKQHEEKKIDLHNECVQLHHTFLFRFEGNVVPINTLIDKVRAEKRSRTKASIIDTVILCGHLGIPLRGQG